MPVCVNVSPPYLSEGAVLAPVDSSAGALGPGAARLRVAEMGDVVVGSKLFVGSGFAAHQEIVTVNALTADASAAGYVFYSVTLARAHTWDESVYRAWSGSVCAPPCEDAHGAFPACLPPCPAWTPCHAVHASPGAIQQPQVPFTPSATGYTPGHAPPPAPPLPPSPTPPPVLPTPYTPAPPVYRAGPPTPYPSPGH
jgi:hypothetical protein